ncbi:MAG: tetratricopeptide repeat protein [Flavobacteriales bacterium]|jgi:hypothetical protein
MKASDHITFPTDTEMRLYTTGLMSKRRKAEIEVLSRQYELIADALEGYKLLFSIWLKRIFVGGSVIIVLSLGGLYFHQKSALVISQRAVASSVSEVEVSSIIKIESKREKSAVLPRRKLLGPEKPIAQPMPPQAIERVFIYEPDSVFIHKEQEARLREGFSKRYQGSGNKIRFVEGYMLSDHEYTRHHSLEVPKLGGVPAEFENRREKEGAAQEFGGHLIDLKDQLDKAIVNYSEGLYDAAILKLEALSKKFPKDVNLNFYLGMCYYQKENYDVALYHFGESVTFENDLFDQEQDFYIAMCYLNKGEEKLAREYFEIIAHSNSFYRDKARAQMD